MPKSPADQYRDAFYARRAKWVKQLKPPYDCPICGGTKKMRKPVIVKVKKKDPLVTISIWCVNGCFFRKYERLKSFEPVDAYCEVIDSIREGLKEIEPLEVVV